MVHLMYVESPDQFEELIQSLPNFPATSTLLQSKKTVVLLSSDQVSLIKKEIIKYIQDWKSNPALFASALNLIESLSFDCVFYRSNEDQYINGMQRNLQRIQATLSSKYNSIPTQRQKKALSNLKEGIECFYRDKAISNQISHSLFDTPCAEGHLDVFVSHFFGSQYSANYYKDNF